MKGHRKEGGVGGGSGLPSTVCEPAAIVARMDKTDEEGQAEAGGCLRRSRLGGLLRRGRMKLDWPCFCLAMIREHGSAKRVFAA